MNVFQKLKPLFTLMDKDKVISFICGTCKEKGVWRRKKRGRLVKHVKLTRQTVLRSKHGGPKNKKVIQEHSHYNFQICN